MHTKHLAIMSSPASEKKSKKKTATFPMILHYMLSELEKESAQPMMSWQPNGRCFKVHRPKQVEKTILPLYVALANMSIASF